MQIKIKMHETIESNARHRKDLRARKGSETQLRFTEENSDLGRGG